MHIVFILSIIYMHNLLCVCMHTHTFTHLYALYKQYWENVYF